ncbi:MAG: hypothetical protein WC637_13630 [Victivallales bacterium]
MKKEILIKRKQLLDAIEKTNSVEELLNIGTDSENVLGSIAVKTYRKAIAEAKTGSDFAQIIEHMSYINEDVFDCGFLCDEAALAGARKFKEQLKLQNSENDEEMELWDKSELKRLIDAIDEFLGDYLLIEKILNPGIKNDDCEWREPGKQG